MQPAASRSSRGENISTCARRTQKQWYHNHSLGGDTVSEVSVSIFATRQMAYAENGKMAVNRRCLQVYVYSGSIYYALEYLIC